jgi:hypothetical protein
MGGIVEAECSYLGGEKILFSWFIILVKSVKKINFNSLGIHRLLLFQGRI